MMRKLLYHRGIDDSAGTYITDYCQFAICVCLSVVLSVLIITSRRTHPNAVKASSYAVTALLAALGLMSIFGGLTHQYLQQVEPYTTWRDNWTWLILWRIGASFAAILCFCFLYIGYFLLCEQKMISFSRRVNIFLGSLSFVMSLAVFIFSLISIKREVDPWSIKLTLMITQACALFDAICSTAATCKINADPEINQQEIDEEEGSILGRTSEDKEKRTDLVLFCLAAWIFLLAGTLQFVLGKFGCADHDDHEIYPCPLPKYFNHNALMHVIIMVDAVLFFLAEYCAIKKRKKISRDYPVKKLKDGF